MILIITILTLFNIVTSLDIYEQQFICLYEGIQGFPVNCSDAANGCNYPGIYCDSNLSLITFNVRLCGGKNIFPDEINNLVSLTGFQVTVQDYCNTPSQGTIPKFTKTNIQYIGLADLDIIGTIPTELMLNTKLISFNVANTKLSGTIPELYLFTELTDLRLYNNNFTGVFPDISNLTKLQYLQIQNNNFTGNLPNVENCNQLTIYDVSVNKFIGDVAVFDSTWLYSVDVSGNMLSGSISNNVLINTNNQVAISMRFNKLTGTIPTALFTANLIVLDLSSNYLSGTIPKEIINTNPHVQQIILSKNILSGTLPTELNNVQFSDLFKFDVSHNNLQGNIPSFEMMTQTSPSIAIPIFTLYKGVIYMELYSNNFSGTVPHFSNFKAPASLDFSHNMLDLDVNSFGSGGNISWLNLANNDITTVGNLNMFQELISLNLGYNRITGTIPSLFSAQYLKLNNNYFTGTVDDLLINPNYTAKPIFVDLTLNRLDIDVGRNTIFGTQSTLNSVNTEIIVNNIPQDVDECLLNMSLCEQICIDGYYPVGSYTCGCQSGYFLDPVDKVSCHKCADDAYTVINYPENNELFPNFRKIGYYNLTFKFSSCSKCSNGITVSTRKLLADPSCISESSSLISTCSFACSNLAVFTSASESLFSLKREFETDDFLNDIVFTLFKVNITINDKNKRGESGLIFEVSNCSNNILSNISDIITALSQDIIPNIPSSKMSIDENSCNMELVATDIYPTKNIVLISVLGFVGLILITIMFAILILIGIYKSSDLHYLPKEISWSFIDQIKHPWKWEYEKLDQTGYYYRDYKFGSNDYDRVEVLLTKLKKGALKVLGITAIYNPTLTSNFINQWKTSIQRYRENHDLFYTCGYRKDTKKMEVLDYYNRNIVSLLDCNNELDIPLIPSLHGSDIKVAYSIAGNGFASLSSLDSGFYSAGIYKTTSFYYCLPYAVSKREPAIILSYVNMGNVYAVTECHKGPKSLMGSSLKSGYNSHYVLTNKDGHVYDKGEICDELVIGQESQILPSFIIKLDHDSCTKEYDKWKTSSCTMQDDNRDVVINMSDTI
jgi:hypothetical protein